MEYENPKLKWIKGDGSGLRKPEAGKKAEGDKKEAEQGKGKKTPDMNSKQSKMEKGSAGKVRRKA